MILHVKEPLLFKYSKVHNNKIIYVHDNKNGGEGVMSCNFDGKAIKKIV